MAKIEADEELRKRIAQARRKKDGSVLFVLGAGVAKGASGGASAADWSGLLELGLSECEALKTKRKLKFSATFDGAELRSRLQSKQAADLIMVASAVEKALRGSGVYARWLKDSVGTLPLTSREVFDALAELELPIATCNYDGLIETALKRQAITWRDHPMVLRFLKGQQAGVLHLHGHYNEPDSVVLGVDSYAAIIGSGHAQAVQRALFLERTLVFIGFGAGLEDPNLGALLEWAGQVVPGADCFHVRLCRDSEVGTLLGAQTPTQRIHVLGYGAEHSHLAPYLRSLAGKGGGKSIASAVGSEHASERLIVPAAALATEITSVSVRAQLYQELTTAADFDAFCIDYFKTIHARFTSGMDRVERTNKLLELAKPAEIDARLRERKPKPPTPDPPSSKGGRSRDPLPPQPPREPPPRPQVNALLFLDRTAQYGRLLVGSPQSRKQNRVLLLHGGPEQNIEWFVKRVEEFLQDDLAEGGRPFNVPLRLNYVYASTAEDWALHLKHTLEGHLGESTLPLAELISQAAERGKLLLSLVVENNPLTVLGTLSARQRAGLKDFLTNLLPKLLTDSRRTGITVLLPLEVHKSGDASDLLTEVQGWLMQAWHTDDRSHDVLPEVRFPTWDDVASYLRSHHPPLNDLQKVLGEAEQEYAKFGQQSTFEQLAKALNNIVARHSS